MRHLTSVTAGLTAALLIAAPSVLNLAPATAASTTPTAFALKASGYGTRVHGGQVPAHSSTTAFEAIGCTNVAGKMHENHVVEADLPGAGTAQDVTSQEWTTHGGGVVASHATSSVASMVLGDASTMGTVAIDAIRSTVTASHGPDGFKAVTHTSIGSITYTDSTGMSQNLDAPTPGQPVEIPGLATINLGRDGSTHGANFASAIADALTVTMTAFGTSVVVAHAKASVGGDVKHGLFNGRSSGITSQALDNNVSVGEQPLTLMPCQGTEGRVHAKDLAGLTLDGGMVLQGVHSSQLGDQTKAAATGQAVGQVASMDLGDGQLVVDTIKGVVNVKRTDSGLTSNIKGSTIGSITANGEPQEFPPSDVLEIPGVARLERNVVEKTSAGLSVVALRVTLLDGSGAVIDLGNASLYIHKLAQ